jgi:hypothetical protein
MASVYVVGQVLGGHGVAKGNKDLHCPWELVTSPHWQRERGLTKGHTQIDSPKIEIEAIWAHPVDVHYLVSERVQGWPKCQLQVFRRTCSAGMKWWGTVLCTRLQNPASAKWSVRAGVRCHRRGTMKCKHSSWAETHSLSRHA